MGIPISEDIKGRILEWGDKFQISNNKFQIRWIEPKNLHVTLVPPWEEVEWKVASNKLQVVECEPFEISFNKIELGLNDREPRMIWLSGNASEEIKKLKKLIERHLESPTIKRDGRHIYQHVTLARFRSEHRSEHMIRSGQQNFPLPVDWRMTVEKFVLYRSHLLPQGSDYEVLAEFPLR